MADNEKVILDKPGRKVIGEVEAIRQDVLNFGANPSTAKRAILSILDLIEELHRKLNRRNKVKDMGWTSKMKIKGIGLETKKDIEEIYPTEEDLKDAIRYEERIPLLNSVADKLKQHYKQTSI